MRSNPLHLHRASRLLVPAALTLALAACMVGPEHVRPTLSVPEQVVRDDASAVAVAPLGRHRHGVGTRPVRPHSSRG